MPDEDSLPPLGQPESGFAVIRLAASELKALLRRLDSPPQPNERLRATFAPLPPPGEIPQAATDDLVAMFRTNWNRACDAGLIQGPRYDMNEPGD